MKIAVNTRLLLKDKLEGLGRFSLETLKRITERHPEHEFIFLFDRAHDESFIFSDNITPISVKPPTRHPFLTHVWLEWTIPPVMRKHKCDMFLSPDGHLSLNSQIKQLPVIHDLNFEHYPRLMPKAARAYYKFYMPKFARKGARVATVSEFSKQDISRQYNIDRGKIDVVYNGASSEFSPLSEPQKKEAKNKFAGGDPYFVYVGALQPRKNIPMLMKAFDLFKESDIQNLKLVLVGDKWWWNSEHDEVYNNMRHRDDVIFAGRLSGEDVNAAIGGSEAMVYVSLFEGFGIPIIEAMQCEVPVVTSGVTSMPEIAGDAAVKVSPFSPESISEGLKKVLDPTVKNRLIEAGKAQREKFSWDKTADLLWDSLMKAYEE